MSFWTSFYQRLRRRLTPIRRHYTLDRYRFRISRRQLIAATTDRDLHGPCVVRAANGDLLLCHQDSQQHLGGDGYVHQWRSRDHGDSWCDEGAVADWRGRGVDALFGEYGRADDGGLVMLVQRRRRLSDDDGISDSWLYRSGDHGHHWQEVGPIDATPQHFLSPRNVVNHAGLLYTTTWSPQGQALYVSSDHGHHWQRRSMVFDHTDPNFPDMSRCGPPFYPQVVFCPDGSLLALNYYTPPRNHCYSRRSHDQGHTWSAVRAEPGLTLWAPRLRRYDDALLILTGRDYRRHATVARFSLDGGESWSEPWVIDLPRHNGSYAYTDSIPLTDHRLGVYTSSPVSPGKGAIVGITLEVTHA